VVLVSCSSSRRVTGTGSGVAGIAQRTLFADSGLALAHMGVSIFDPSIGHYLYSYQDDKYFIPASNMKLFMCYAAMKYLGDSIVAFKYQLPSPTTIIIQPSGDPTFLHPDFREQPALDFLKKFSSVKIAAAPGKVEPIGSGWSWNDYMEDYMAERSQMPIYGNLVRIRKPKGAELAIQPPLVPQQQRSRSIPGRGL